MEMNTKCQPTLARSLALVQKNAKIAAKALIGPLGLSIYFVTVADSVNTG
jgi:hypothetical protein